MKERKRKREANEVKKSRQSSREIVGFVGPEVRLRLRVRVERRDNWERLETISKFQRDEAYRFSTPLPFLGQFLSYRASSGNTRRLHGPSCSGNQHFRDLSERVHDVRCIEICICKMKDGKGIISGCIVKRY